MAELHRLSVLYSGFLSECPVMLYYPKRALVYNILLHLPVKETS